MNRGGCDEGRLVLRRGRKKDGRRLPLPHPHRLIPRQTLSRLIAISWDAVVRGGASRLQDEEVQNLQQASSITYIPLLSKRVRLDRVLVVQCVVLVFKRWLKPPRSCHLRVSSLVLPRLCWRWPHVGLQIVGVRAARGEQALRTRLRAFSWRQNSWTLDRCTCYALSTSLGGQGEVRNVQGTETSAASFQNLS
eukprot:745754-Hanusia_phi.AAC.1